MTNTEKRKEGSNKDFLKSIDRDTGNGLKTEQPYGEKDEVKRAEDKLRKAAKKSK
jgi:hypothetical protein